MKILLTAVNSKYIHSNLAIYCLRAYAKEYVQNISIAEYTINNRSEEILREIYKQKPDIVAFSCYIWNIEMIREISVELKKILPQVKIWWGGPEVSYDSKKELGDYPMVVGIMRGEGEATFKELVRYYLKEVRDLNEIAGITYRNDRGEIVENNDRMLLSLDSVPFVYDDLSKFENKIIYYESSRGCPFSCEYCLSSIDKKLRFRSFEIVKSELNIFLREKVRQVKFVDRTFNCNKKHAMNIWQYLIENDNGITNFHFEISADLLDDEILEMLKKARIGLFQFEIGVQSTMLETLSLINRKMDFNRVSEIVRKIQLAGNIHLHLDLIAGLPRESYNDFKKSFNDVYALRPEQLQLGFLKVLKGTRMHNNRDKYGIKYKDKAPYEVLSTNELAFDELLKLKMVEEMLETYYNSGQFSNTIIYLESFFDTPFELYESLANYYEKNDLHLVQHSRVRRYDIILNYFSELFGSNTEIIKSLLLVDLYLQENMKKRPEWAFDIDLCKEEIRSIYSNEQLINEFLPEYKEYSPKQIAKMTHIEVLSINLFKKDEKSCYKREKTYILFNYLKRNPLVNHAEVIVLEGENK